MGSGLCFIDGNLYFVGLKPCLLLILLRIQPKTNLAKGGEAQLQQIQDLNYEIQHHVTLHLTCKPNIDNQNKQAHHVDKQKTIITNLLYLKNKNNAAQMGLQKWVSGDILFFGNSHPDTKRWLWKSISGDQTRKLFTLLYDMSNLVSATCTKSCQQ